MARKKTVAKPAAEKTELNRPVRVKSVSEDCWAGGSGFLSPGDEAMVTPDAAERLLKEKKIELVKG